MTNTLKQSIKNHLDRHQLDEGQLKILQSLETESPPESADKKWYQFVGIAAAIFLMIGVLLFQNVPSPDAPSMHLKIASEVVSNHLKQRPLEVASSKLKDIRAYFSDVSFQPVFSRYLKTRELNLLGGRYCSIQGVTAAQLRFSKNDSPKRHTLYEVAYDVDKFKYVPDYDANEQPVSIYSKGVMVTLWVEKGIMFALTED